VKPFSIALSIVLVIASLSVVVWIGRYGAVVPTTTQTPTPKPPATADDVPLPASGPYGKAEAPETEFDFGMKIVHPEKQHEHVFTVKNIGEGKLDFKLGEPTCQCTKVEIQLPDGKLVMAKTKADMADEKTAAIPDSGTLMPGETMNVLIRWITKMKMDKFRHGVKIFTNDPDMRTIDLAVVGTVDAPIVMRPEGTWELGEMLQREPSKAEGHVYTKVFNEFELTEEPREKPLVRVTLEALDPKTLAEHNIKSGYLVKIEAGPDVPVGMLRESVKLKAKADDDEYIVEFSVTGHRGGPIEVRGVKGGAGFNAAANRLNFLEFPAAQGKTVSLTMFAKNFDSELLLNGVEPADTRFQVKLEKGDMLGKSQSYQLKVTIPPGPVERHRGLDAEKIHLKFNHPEAPDFELLLDYNATR
jgi:hypothetical protein